MDVKVVELKPMRVVSFRALGTSPEQAAWEKLMAWAKPLGLAEKKNTRFFGFNNPNPSPGKAEYGYEVWITVPKDFKDPNVKDFPGGHYLVHRVEVPKGRFEAIGKGWNDLDSWRKKNGYRSADNLCLEETVRTDRKDLEFILDLYDPVEPKQ
ncbi:MAG: GyrI-like domain-containing protein [Thermoplasmata archaeon]|nr:GyrI-like domain-containing protein [Thermoplasmata archaeon]